MARTDQEDRTSRWTFAGFLNGVRAAFGLGGNTIVSAEAKAMATTRAVAIAKQKIAAESGRADSYLSGRTHLSKAKLAMWRNNYRDVVVDKLKSNFHPLNFVRMRLMVHTSSNVLQRVISDVSLTYASPARRSIEVEKPEPVVVPLSADASVEEEQNEGSVVPPAVESSAPLGGLNTGDPDVDALSEVLELEGSDKREDSPLDKLYKHAPLDATMETVEWFSRFLPAVFVRPFVRYTEEMQGDNGENGGNPDSGKLDYLIYTPDVADVVPDPDCPTEALAFYYWAEDYDEKGKARKVIHFFQKDIYMLLDEQWRVLKSGPNSLGELPVVTMRLGKPTHCFYLDGQGDDLFEGTLELAVLRTIQNARARDSGFKQLVFTNADKEEVDADQVMGGPTPIFTNDGGSASVLDMQSNLTEWTELCRERALELAAKYGVSSAEYKAEGAPQSGFAKKLDHDKILKENERTRKFFVEFERELYKKTRRVLGVSPVSAIGELPDAELIVDFAEPSFSEDPKVQAVVDAQRIKLNLDSIIDILRRENPDLSEEELVKKASKNKKINEAFISSSALRVVDFLAGVGQQVAPTTPGQEPPEVEE